MEFPIDVVKVVDVQKVCYKFYTSNLDTVKIHPYLLLWWQCSQSFQLSKMIIV